MSIETLFSVTSTISLFFYGKVTFDLHSYFQECNYHGNQEVAVYR